ncbi:MAG: nucleotide-binding protein [Pseudomonadota bacterium]
MNETKGLFRQLNNAVLDLQGADYQSFARPLSRIGKILASDDLAQINEELTKDLNLDGFLKKSDETGGSMVGSATLVWPDEDKEILGTQLLLIQRLCADPDWTIAFAGKFYVSHSRKYMRDVQQLVAQLIIPFARDYREYVETNGQPDVSLAVPVKSNKVFIVHGHDGEARETVARFVEKIGLVAIILHEQANKGRTVIEKVEANSDVGFAIVLLTPDDVGRSVASDELEPRARQNVLLELGYFIGQLGREKVCALKKGTLEIPSDFAGVVWENMDDAGGWKQALARELEASGQAINWNQVMRP